MGSRTIHGNEEGLLPAAGFFAYHVALHELKLKALDVGGRGDGTLNPNSTDYWSFSGTEGKTVRLSVSSSVRDPIVGLYNPDGMHLGSVL